MAQQADIKDKTARIGAKTARSRDKQLDQAHTTLPSSAPARPTTTPAPSSAAPASSTPTSSSSSSASLFSPPLLASDNDTPTPAVPNKRAAVRPTSAMADDKPLVEGKDNEGEPDTQNLLESASAPGLAAAAPVPPSSATAVGSGASSTAGGAASAPPGDQTLLSSLVMQECVRLGKELAAAAEREAEQARREAQLVAQVERLEREVALWRSSRVGGQEEKPASSQSAQGGGRDERGGARRGGGGGPSAGAARARPAAAASGQKGSASHKASQASSGTAAATSTGSKEVELGDESADIVIIHRRARAVPANPSASTSALGHAGEAGDQGESSQGNSQVGAARRSSSSFETIVISDSEADSSNVPLDAAVASIVAASRRSAAATPPITHRSTLSPGLSSSPDTPSPVRNAEAIPHRASSLASPDSDVSIVSASTVPNAADEYQGALGNENSASYDAGESSMSTVGEGSGEVSSGSSFEESQVDAGSVGSGRTVIYRDDVESDWTMRTDSQYEPTQPSQPSQLPAAAAPPLAAAATTTSRAVAPPPAAPLVDTLAALSLDPHEVEDEPETQETQPVRAPGAWPASDSEEESMYVDAKETQTSP